MPPCYVWKAIWSLMTIRARSVHKLLRQSVGFTTLLDWPPAVLIRGPFSRLPRTCGRMMKREIHYHCRLPCDCSISGKLPVLLHRFRCCAVSNVRLRFKYGGPKAFTKRAKRVALPPHPQSTNLPATPRPLLALFTLSPCTRKSTPCYLMAPNKVRPLALIISRTR